MTDTITGTARRSLSAEQQWTDALDAFASGCARRGIAERTTIKRTRHVARFARECGLYPWAVSADDVFAWLGRLGGADLTQATYRDSLRAFYRWAHAAGRVEVDPTHEDSRRAREVPVPDQWAPPLHEFRSWLRVEGHPESTVNLYLHRLRRFARDHASADPYAITLDELVEWLSGKRWSRETRRGNRSTLRRFYHWAQTTGRVRKSPAKKLPVVSASTPRARPAQDADIQTAIVRGDRREVLALRMAAELGMRRTEVARAHSRDLSADGDGWVLSVLGKGDRVRRIPVPFALATSIRTRGEGYLFPGRDHGHISPRYLGKRISALLPPGVTMHALRHRFATAAYSVDRDTFAVQQLLGHASAATTQRYVQVTSASQRRLVEAVAGV